MGEAKRRKEIALERNSAYNCDPITDWTDNDRQRLELTFTKFLEQEFLNQTIESGLRKVGRGAIVFSLFRKKPVANYVPASFFLLSIYESGFKNRLQKAFQEYDTKTQFILIVTYSDSEEVEDCTYDYAIASRSTEIPRS